MKIGLIGFGRLGKMIHQYMGIDCDMLIHDPFSKNIPEGKESELTELSQCHIIIIAVPMSEFENTIIKLSNHLENKETLIIDVCSVKMMPIEAMEKHLPKSTSILGTHPMFGPDSASDTLFGRKIVLTPVRIKDKLYNDITKYLQNHGIRTIESTATEHDKQISNSLNLTHLIGRSLLDFNASSLDIDTKGYRRLMKILSTVENDSWQLFHDMNKFNPYAKDTRENFKKSLLSIIDRLDEE